MAKIKPGSKEYFAILKDVKDYYERFECKLIQAQVRGGWFNAYGFDWMQIFSEAEYQVWCIIRSRAKIQLYPQYPIGKYFVDFGNPYYRIALEVDGKDFHNQEKDKSRDQEIFSEYGWKVFRVSGAEAYRYISKDQDFTNEETGETDYSQYREWLMTSAEGVIEAISARYFQYDAFTGSQFRKEYDETLNAHRLADFKL